MTKIVNASTARLILVTNMIFGYRKIEHMENADMTEEALRAKVEDDMKIILECAATKDTEKLNAHFKDDNVLLAALDDSVAMWDGLAAQAREISDRLYIITITCPLINTRCRGENCLAYEFIGSETPHAICKAMHNTIIPIV